MELVGVAEHWAGSCRPPLEEDDANEVAQVDEGVVRELQHVAGLGALVHHQLVVLFEEALQEDDDGGEEDDAEPDGQAKKKKVQMV